MFKGKEGEGKWKTEEGAGEKGERGNLSWPWQ
jgi:hypothetical protein